MNRIINLLCAALFLLSSTCVGQDDSYDSQIDRLIREAENLSSPIETNALDFDDYDNWYKNFKNISEPFEKRFFETHKHKKSFRSMKEGLDGLSLAWGELSRAQNAENQYRESITLHDVSYAHKWKSEAANHRKKAYGTIAQALESLKGAKAYSEDENE